MGPSKSEDKIEPVLEQLVREGKLAEAHAYAVAASAGEHWSVLPLAVLLEMRASLPGEPGERLVVDTLRGKAPTKGRPRAAWTAALFHGALRQWRNTDFVVGVSIRTGNLPCPEAGSICGCWKLADVPEVPPLNCSSEWGCTCLWLAIFRDEQPSSPWRS